MTIHVRPPKSWRNRPDWDSRYEAYLASAGWIDLRQTMIQRAEHVCEGCARDESYEGFSALAMQIHHRDYKRLGDELGHHLMVLCSECHEEADEIREDRNADLAAWNAKVGWWLSGVCGHEWRSISLLRSGVAGWIYEYHLLNGSLGDADCEWVMDQAKMLRARGKILRGIKR